MPVKVEDRRRKLQLPAGCTKSSAFCWTAVGVLCERRLVSKPFETLEKPESNWLFSGLITLLLITGGQQTEYNTLKSTE